MPETFQNNQIAAGHNNAAGLANIETLVDSAGRYFNPVKDLLNYSPGLPLIRGDGIVIYTGQISFTWETNLLWLEQWNYLYATLLSNSTSGLVTVKTRQYTTNTYANYNATLSIGAPNELQYKLGYIENFVWRFSRVTAL